MDELKHDHIATARALTLVATDSLTRREIDHAVDGLSPDDAVEMLKGTLHAFAIAARVLAEVEADAKGEPVESIIDTTFELMRRNIG